MEARRTLSSRGSQSSCGDAPPSQAYVDEFKFQSILAEDLLDFYLEYFPELKARRVDAIPGEQRGRPTGLREVVDNLLSSTPGQTGVGDAGSESPGRCSGGRRRPQSDVSPSSCLLFSCVFPYRSSFSSPLGHVVRPLAWPRAAHAKLTEPGARGCLGWPSEWGGSECHLRPDA